MGLSSEASARPNRSLLESRERCGAQLSEVGSVVFRACSDLIYRLGKDVELWGESLCATVLIWV